MRNILVFGAFPHQWGWIFSGSALDGVTAHVMRHSFASLANDLGFTEVTIAALVGHAKGSVTSQYIHTLDSALVMAADTIAGCAQGNNTPGFLGFIFAYGVADGAPYSFHDYIPSTHQPLMIVLDWTEEQLNGDRP